MERKAEKKWTWNHNSASDKDYACIEIHDENRLQIAYIQSSEHIGGVAKAQAEENARLLAAAPCLLEALEAMYESVDSGVELTPEVMRTARAAIARATGTKS